MKSLYLLAACSLLTASLAFSQTHQAQTPQIRAKTKLIQAAPTTCPNDPVLVSDGTAVLDQLIFPSSLAYFQINAKAGHSYAVEMYDPIDNTFAMAPVIKVTSDCNTSITGVMDVTNVDPDISGGFSDRVSWIQGSSDQILYIQVSNPDPNNGYNYDFRVTDTTLFNPRWSTYSNFDTQWGITNTTTSAITGTLTVFDPNGAVLKTITQSFPAGLFTLISARAKGVPVPALGDATFAYVGPAGAILADSYGVGPGNATIVPFKFEGKHAYH